MLTRPVDTEFGVLCYDIDAEERGAESNKSFLIIRVIRKEALNGRSDSRGLLTTDGLYASATGTTAAGTGW
jgi:hypothetical protein